MPDNTQIDFEAIAVEIEIDEVTGDVTAFNDDLRIMAVADDEIEARQGFRDAVTSQVRFLNRRGIPLPAGLREHVRQFAEA